MFLVVVDKRVIRMMKERAEIDQKEMTAMDANDLCARPSAKPNKRARYEEHKSTEQRITYSQ